MGSCLDFGVRQRLDPSDQTGLTELHPVDRVLKIVLTCIKTSPLAMSTDDRCTTGIPRRLSNHLSRVHAGEPLERGGFEASRSHVLSDLYGSSASTALFTDGS